MITAVDTNALLALLYDDEHADASESVLRRAYQDGRVVISPIVYAELAADGHFESSAALDEFCDDLRLQLDAPSQEALFRAGVAFQEYTDRRPDGLQCPTCGTDQTVPCTECGTALAPRQHIAADFLIGAHAVVDCDRLLTFDTAFYETYFPAVTVRPE